MRKETEDMNKLERPITMSRPAASDLLHSDESTYSLVIAVAKRARRIAEDLEEQHLPLDEKPVKIAVKEFAEGKYKMIEAADAEA